MRELHPNEAFCLLCGSQLTWSPESTVGKCTFVDCKHRWQFSATSRYSMPEYQARWVATDLGTDKDVPSLVTTIRNNAIRYLRDVGFDDPEALLEPQQVVELLRASSDTR